MEKLSLNSPNPSENGQNSEENSFSNAQSDPVFNASKVSFYEWKVLQEELKTREAEEFNKKKANNPRKKEAKYKESENAKDFHLVRRQKQQQAQYVQQIMERKNQFFQPNISKLSPQEMWRMQQEELERQHMFEREQEWRRQQEMQREMEWRRHQEMEMQRNNYQRYQSFYPNSNRQQQNFERNANNHNRQHNNNNMQRNYPQQNKQFNQQSQQNNPQQIVQKNVQQSSQQNQQADEQTNKQQTQPQNQSANKQKPTKGKKQPRPKRPEKPVIPNPLKGETPISKEERSKLWREYRQAMKPFKHKEFHNAKRQIQRYGKKDPSELNEKQLEQLKWAQEYCNEHRASLTIKNASRFANAPEKYKPIAGTVINNQTGHVVKQTTPSSVIPLWQLETSNKNTSKTKGEHELANYGYGGGRFVEHIASVEKTYQPSPPQQIPPPPLPPPIGNFNLWETSTYNNATNNYFNQNSNNYGNSGFVSGGYLKS